MAASLDALVKATPKESLKIIEELAKALNGDFELLVKKEVYLYEYMDSFEKFAETSLPPWSTGALFGKPSAERTWAIITTSTGRQTWRC